MDDGLDFATRLAVIVGAVKLLDFTISLGSKWFGFHKDRDERIEDKIKELHDRISDETAEMRQKHGTLELSLAHAQREIREEFQDNIRDHEERLTQHFDRQIDSLSQRIGDLIVFLKNGNGNSHPSPRRR